MPSCQWIGYLVVALTRTTLQDTTVLRDGSRPLDGIGVEWFSADDISEITRGYVIR